MMKSRVPLVKTRESFASCLCDGRSLESIQQNHHNMERFIQVFVYYLWQILFGRKSSRPSKDVPFLSSLDRVLQRLAEK